MKTEKFAAISFLIFAMVSCIISCLMLSHEDWFLRHIATIGIGVGVMLLIAWAGHEFVLASSGSTIAIAVCLACLGLLLESPNGCNAILYIGERPIVTPGFFIAPAFVIAMAYLWQIKDNFWMVIIAAFACMLIPAVTLHAGVSKLMMALVCALVPLAVTKQRRRLCIILFGFIVAILLVRVFVCGKGAEHLFDDWRVEYYAEAIRRTPWFGAYSGARTFKPFGGPWEDPVTHALLTLGRFVIPALIVALSLLTAASASIMFKKMDSARKIIVCGAALSFAIPLVGSVARLYFPLRIGRWSVPFLSPGGSSMVASFALLGLALTALDGEVRGLAKRTGILGRQIGRVVGVTLVGLTVVSVGVIVYQDYHSRLARIERAIPKTDGKFSYDIRGAVEMSDGTIWLPCREIKGIGEPSVVVSVNRCRNGVVIQRHKMPTEPPIVRTACRLVGGNGVAADCTDLFKREYTLTVVKGEDANE